MTNMREVVAEANGYELVRYATGDCRIEHPGSQTCSIWLTAGEVADIMADPAIISRWATEVSMDDEEEEEKITIQINPIAIHVKLDNLGELHGLDPVASVTCYCDQLRDAVAREFPGAEIRITTGGHSSMPYIAYIGDVEAPEAVQRRLRALSGAVFAANEWQVLEAMEAQTHKTPWTGWHFLAKDCKLRYNDGRKVIPGKVYRAEGALVLCKNGMHASASALDALKYAPGPIICRVELSGDLIEGADKAVARCRKVLWMADATRTLHLFAVWCAERALIRERNAGREPDPRSWNALKVKRAWLDGKATDKELEDARVAAWAAEKAAERAAAWDAARAAAERAAAWSAARAAAWAVERDAAWGAAFDAERAAAWDADRAAALDVEKEAQARKLESMLLALAPSSGDPS